jgi:hypothetical protein
MRRVAAGRVALVSPRWRHAAAVAVRALESVLVVRRAGGDRAAARPEGEHAADRRATWPISVDGLAELRRNAATRCGVLEYRASVAQWKAERAARRPKPAKLAVNERLRDYVQDRLSGALVDADGNAIAGPQVQWKGRRHGRRQYRCSARAWSPEQIARRLPLDFPDDASMRVSHEAIYQALFVQGRGALRRELTACLRSGRALRVPRRPDPQPRQGLRDRPGEDQPAAGRG